MKKVKMYTLSTCPWCNKAKQYFDKQHLAYDYVDYDLANGSTQRIIEKKMRALGVDGFPLVRIGTKFVQGYDPKKYKELLAS